MEWFYKQVDIVPIVLQGEQLLCIFKLLKIKILILVGLGTLMIGAEPGEILHGSAFMLIIVTLIISALVY